MENDNQRALASFIAVYSNLGASNLESLSTVYHPDIVFQDPVHRVEGLAAMTRYFQSLFTDVLTCQFTITQQILAGDLASVFWCMHFSHPRLGKGKRITVEGTSQLTFAQGKVIFHRDYFDMGQMLYQHLPMLGWAVKALNHRMAEQ